jgi:hypothetical protein
MKKSSYMTRAMQARDPRYARVLSSLGYERADLVADDAAPMKKKAAHPPKPAPQGNAPQKAGAGEAMAALRKQYQEVIGKKPFAGWDTDTLKVKIAKAKG